MASTSRESTSEPLEPEPYESSETSIPDPYETSGEDDPDYDPKSEKKEKYITDFFRTADMSRPNSTASTSKNLITKKNEDEVLTKIQRSPILDGKFFQVVSQDELGTHIQAQCQLCLPNNTIIKGSLNITTNFIKHFKKKHATRYDSYIQYKKEKQLLNWQRKRKSSNNSSDNSGLPLPGLPKEKKIRQSTLTLSINKKSSQKSFDDKIIKFIVDTMSPISIISHHSFINMFEGMNVKVMDRSVAVKKIDNMYQNMYESIRLNISKVNYVCTTADIWSSKRRSFLGVTCHWLDQDLKRHSVALACKRFAGTHSYDRIAEALEEINKEFQLDTNKLLATITDNGSNFVKCFKEFGLTITTATEEPYSVEENIIITEDNDEADDEEEYSFLSFEPNETLGLAELTPDDLSTDTVMIRYLPQHLRCASHTINLIATTDYNNSLKTSNTLRQKHTQIFAKCSKLWNKGGRPKTAEIIKEVLGHGHTLSIPGVTRWNSTYDAISKIVSVKEKLGVLCEKLMIPAFKENEISFLEEYLNITQPLAETLDFLQGEYNTYYGYLLPSLVSMKTKLQKLKSSGNIKQLLIPLEVITNSIDKRFKELFTLSTESKTAVIAAVVCPRFKMRWYNVFKDSTVQTSIKDIQTWLVSAVESFVEGNYNNKEAELAKSVQLKDDPFFDFQEDDMTQQQSMSLLASISKTSNSKTPTSSTINTSTSLSELEVLKYLNDTRVNLDMLDDYKYIKSVFIKYNTILPSSAAVERLFSFAQIVNAPRRHALSDNNFEKLVVLKANHNKY